MKQSPIILIGMHRSGTSLVSRVLEATGLFLGQNKDENNEAIYFIQFNKWLLSQAGTSWANPYGFYNILQDTKARRLLSDFLSRAITSPSRIAFLGWQAGLSTKSLEEISQHWGWKDPRTTLTLPLWLDVFPQAKVIHIYRHGVDVANSLRKRSIKQIEDINRIHYFKRYVIFWLFSGYPIWNDRVYLDSVQLRSLEQGFKLWEYYIEQGFSYSDMLGDRIYHIKYEDILDDPITHMKALIEFCNITVSDSKLEDITSMINAKRGFAYLQSDELIQFAESVQPRLAKYGY
ncbi:MAG: sulfotransferase [Chloroflexota bacterium]